MSNTKIKVERSPCTSCPYRKDVPSGVWHFDEYEKLRAYDHEPPTEAALQTFLCHHTLDSQTATVCRGWLAVHQESIAVRLAILRGHVTPEEAYADVAEPLYATGNEAAYAGQRSIEQPGVKARKIIKRLSKNKERK